MVRGGTNKPFCLVSLPHPSIHDQEFSLLKFWIRDGWGKMGIENLKLYKLPGEMSLTDERMGMRTVLWMRLLVSPAAVHDFLPCSDMLDKHCSLLLSLTHEHFDS